jgi:hypothetical protein
MGWDGGIIPHIMFCILSDYLWFFIYNGIFCDTTKCPGGRLFSRKAVACIMVLFQALVTARWHGNVKDYPATDDKSSRTLGDLHMV